VKYM
jgi:hypothetical protein